MTAFSEYNVNALFTGGYLSGENRSCCTGSLTEDAINSIHADFCFFSVQSLTKDGTLYDCFANEIVPRKLMIKNSEKKVFLCDNSKINHYSAYKLCDVSKLDYVISDIDIENYLEKDYPDINFMTGK